jgi:photosystem II stability/assembly factor-like uncharacterized protein
MAKPRNWDAATTLVALAATMAARGTGTVRAADQGITGKKLLLRLLARVLRAWSLAALAGAVFLLAGAYEAQAGVNAWTGHFLGQGFGGGMAVAVDPISPTTLYAGSLAFGVIKSTDGGGIWSTANTGLPLDDYVSALVIDPHTPRILYASEYGSEFSGGVFKSTDAGDSWSAASTGLPVGGRFVTLAIDPDMPSTLYVGTQGDLGDPTADKRLVYKSTDAGDTWSAADTGLPADARLAIGTLAIDPHTPSTLYADLYDAGCYALFTAGGICIAPNPSSGHGVYKSTDAGRTWKAVNVGLPDYFVIGLAIDPRTPSTLYARFGDAVSADGALYKSTDAGETWHLVVDGALGEGEWSANGAIQILAIDPQTTSTLYGIGYCDGVGRTTLTLCKSTDAGATWTLAGAGLPLGFNGGPNIRSLAIDPSAPSTLYAASPFSDFPVYKSTDGGATWKVPGVKRSISALAIDPFTPGTLYMGSDTGVYKSTDGGATWGSTGLSTGVVYPLVIDPLMPGTLYAGVGGGVFKSSDAGDTWSAASTGLPLDGDVGALVIDPHTPGILYSTHSGPEGGLFKSTDAGDTWSAASTGLPANRQVAALAVDPSTPSTLYVATRGATDYSLDGAVFKSTDGGASWASSSTGLTFAFVSLLAIDPHTPSTLYASVGNCGPRGCGGGSLFKSTDGGASWSSAGSGVEGLAFDPQSPGTVYALADGYVFKNGSLLDPRPNYMNLRWTHVIGHAYRLAIDPLTPTTIYAVSDVGLFDIEQVAAVPCVGDCNDDQAVGIDDLLALVNIALGNPGSCQTGVPVGATVDVSLIVQAVNHALSGCDE